MNTETFIENAKSIHGDVYDYKLVEYSGTLIPIDIICSIHGQFSQKPRDHMQGKGCSECGLQRRIRSQYKNTEWFIRKSKEIHGSHYDYSLVDYVSTKDKVKIICPVHGEFSQEPRNHLKGCGCKICPHLISQDDFIQKCVDTHGDIYNYDKVKLENTNTAITITCNIHGDFEQIPNDHRRGRGCPKCSVSTGEKTIRSFLETHNIEYTSEMKFDGCINIRKLPFDFYVPSLNMCIEYDGIQHFKPIAYFGGQYTYDKLVKNDRIKTEFCSNKGIPLLRISYTDNIYEMLMEGFNYG